MRFKNLYSKAIIIGIFIVLIACLFACSKNDKSKPETVSSTIQSENETKMVFATRTPKATSGTCGESATWIYDAVSRTLTIKGTGRINDESSMNQWANYTENIVIEEGITDFHGGIFYDFVNVIEIDLPNSPINIDKNTFSETAFYKDSSNWDNGVLYVDNHLVEANEFISDKYEVKNGTVAICFLAFYKSAITEIVLPDSVIEIQAQAFTECCSLEKIYIGSGLQKMGDIFSEGTELDFYIGPYSLKNITVSEMNGCFSSENGVLYNKNKTELLVFPPANPLKEFKIPNSVHTISKFAFLKAGNIEILTFGDNIESEYFSLYGCISLRKVNVGKGSKTINSLGVCPSLETIEVPESNPYFITVDGVLFNKSKTTLLVYPNAKKEFEYNVPNSVTTIAQGAFCDVVYLKKLYIGKNVVNLESGCFGHFDNINCSWILPFEIYYEGSSNQWKKISLELHEDPVVDYNIYYDSKKFTETTTLEELSTTKSNIFNWF